MTDDEVFELAIDEEIAWDDLHGIRNFILGFRLPEGDQSNHGPD